MEDKVEPLEGAEFELYGSSYVITSTIGGIIRFSALQGGKIFQTPLDKFLDYEKSGFFTYTHNPYHPLINKKNYDAIHRKKSYIEEALRQKNIFSHKTITNLIIDVSKKTDDKNPPSARTVMRWVKSYIENNDYLTNIDTSAGNSTFRFSPEVESIIKTSINNIYLAPKERTFAKDVLANIENYLIENKITVELPSLRTIQRRIKKLDDYELLKNKKGANEANKNFTASGKEQNSPFLMNIVECDSHFIDLIILDDNTLEVIGRPILMCAIDTFSKCIVGWVLSMLPPNTSNTISLLKDMFTRPNKGLPGGIPSLLIPDNGVEFHNNTLSSVCEKLKITIHPAKKYTPDDKPHIESFFRGFALGFVQKMRGTTFSNIKSRGKYDSKASASITFSKLNELIHEWIETVYHQSAHSGISNRIPISFWKETIEKYPVLHLSEKDADILTRIPKERVINGGRINYSYLTYYSHILTEEKYDNKKVTIFIDPTNLEKIYISDPSNKNNYILAYSTNLEYTKNLSLYEHEETLKIKKSLAEKDQRLLGKNIDLYARYQLYVKIQNSYADTRKLKHAKLGILNKFESLIKNTPNKQNPMIEMVQDAEVNIQSFIPEETYSSNMDWISSNHSTDKQDDEDEYLSIEI